MKLLATTAILILLVNLAAISFQPGSGRTVEDPQRAYHLAYHNSTDDLHFYGSADWAVRFDFASYYLPNLTNRSFTISALRLWFPQVGDSVKVKLMTDVDGQPGLPQLADLRVHVVSNQLVLQLPSSVTAQQIWMLVEYQTNPSNRFVSASLGGGTHSFYLNSSMGTPYYQSFAAAGFATELLFGVEGEFTDVNDLRLQSLTLDGDIEPGAVVYPSFSIHNHSAQALGQVSLLLNFLTPEQGANFNRTITIPGVIAPFGDYVWDASHPQYAEQAITLPGEPMQMRLRGTLSGGPPSDLIVNNVIDKYIYTFIETPPIHLVENFIRASHISTVIALEDQIMGADEYRNVHPLNYFPIQADSLSAPGAMARFSWYGSNSTPLVVLGGNRRVPGFGSDFGPDFTAYCDDLITDKSFISAGSVVSTFTSDSIDYRFSFENTQTRFLTGTGVYNLVQGSVLCAGLFRNVVLDGRETWILDRWIAHALPISGSLDNTETLELDLSMPRTGLDADAQYRTYYWIQEAAARQIFFAAYQDLVVPVEVDDELLPAPSLKASPNPLRGQGELSINLAGASTSQTSHLRIYNLRGQLVHSSRVSARQSKLPAAVFPASGIYFICLEGPSRSERPIQTRVTVIK